MALTPELKAAVNHVKSHAQGLRAILTIADALDEVDKLEALAGEAETRRSKAEAAYEALMKSNDELVRAGTQAVKEAEEAKALVPEAKADAKAVLSAAKKQAATVTESAKEQAASLHREAEAVLEKARAGLDEQIEAKKADLAALDDGIKVKLEEVEALEARVAKAKKYLEKLVEA